MQKTRRRGSAVIRMSIAALLGGMAAGSVWADDLPSMGEEESGWKTDVYYENHTAYRGKDSTGKTVGLAKFRNTLQAEVDKKLGDGWAMHGVLRGTYDGVYRMNDTQFGDKAGGAVSFQNAAGAALPGIGAAPVGGGPWAGPGSLAGARGAAFGAGAPNDYLAYVDATYAGNPLTNSTTVPMGQGLGSSAYRNTGVYPVVAPGNTVGSYLNFGFNTAANPNAGLRVLGDRWHQMDGGVAFGVPVRPCDTDKRGCTDFGGYGNLKRSELESPEFNDRFDFIREIYAKKTFGLKDGTDLFVKVGRQQIVWGRTDLFRVLDVFNPVDYSRNNIYDELQDIRIPLWSAQVEWRMGGSESMQDRNLQFVWSFDSFRANNLGQCGSPNAILDAGCFFRGMKNLWDNGGTVANFAGGAIATDFGPGQIGLRNVHLPKWKDAATLGLKFEGVTQEGTSFSLNAMTYRSQLPSLHGGKGANNSFFPAPGNPASAAAWPYLIAFDMEFPRINLIGGSMDFQSEALGASFRLEGALTSGEEFANTARPELYSKNNVFRSVIGIDRPMFIPFINPNRTTLISAQMFYQHIFNHELHTGLSGGPYAVGMPDWENNVIGTLLIKGFMSGDRVSPQLILARDFQAHAWAAAPQVEWSITDDLKLTFGANVKGRDGQARYNFDDARDARPFPALGTAGAYGTFGGIEPLGRFRAGPIGAAFKENDIYFMMRYKF